MMWQAAGNDESAESVIGSDGPYTIVERGLPVILVVGQTPPPYHGQALMVQRLVRARFTKVHVVHVRLAFSHSIAEVGKPTFAKLAHLVVIVLRVILQRVKHRVDVLYYLPAGPSLAPIVRDVLLLGILRPLFPRVILHFRAAGLSEYIRCRSRLFQHLARRTYGNADLAIQLSSRNPPDGAFFAAREVRIIPNGLEDSAAPFLPLERERTERVRFLYAGALSPTKGLAVLIEAFLRLTRDFPVELCCMGAFSSPAFEAQIRERVREGRAELSVLFPGEVRGDDRWPLFLQADVFCFPTFFAAESFGNVVVEAMMFELPVVATRWRGVEDIVEDGRTGLLVRPKDEDQLYIAMHAMVAEPAKRIALGQAGRRRYLEHYQLQTHLARMEEAFVDVCGSG